MGAGQDGSKLVLALLKGDGSLLFSFAWGSNG
jgi:hypothetical protein